MAILIKKVLKTILPESILLHISAYDNYIWGEAEIRLVSYFCDRARTALDIGANIGSYTYFMRKYARHVYAYEPNPELANRLTRLFSDVTVRCAAVSNAAAAELKLRIPVRDGRHMHELASVAQTFPTDTLVEYPVPAVRIDDEDVGDVGFIKIDVEQHEFPALLGAIETIRRFRPVIMVETCPLLYPKELPEMLAFITDENYNGFFKFQRHYLPLTMFLPNIHARADNYPTLFMEPNVILLPSEQNSSFLQSR